MQYNIYGVNILKKDRRQITRLPFETQPIIPEKHKPLADFVCPACPGNAGFPHTAPVRTGICTPNRRSPFASSENSLKSKIHHVIIWP